jgi:hypothetical protein
MQRRAAKRLFEPGQGGRTTVEALPYLGERHTIFGASVPAPSIPAPTANSSYTFVKPAANTYRYPCFSHGTLRFPMLSNS